MHCHTREGSLDGQVAVAVYATKLKKLGYGGMLVTDHDSYKGYRAWLEKRDNHQLEDFRVWRGIEYDTIDAGHMLVIMPKDVELPLLELRGLPVSQLAQLVHKRGGILGPAHPYGVKFQSFCFTRKAAQIDRLLPEFDFIETWNACEDEKANAKAAELAKRFGKPGTGGSDAHRLNCVGLGYTELPDDLVTETDLIIYLRGCNKNLAGGEVYSKTLRSHNQLVNQFLIHAYYFYNHLSSWFRFHRRKLEWQKFLAALRNDQFPEAFTDEELGVLDEGKILLDQTEADR